MKTAICNNKECASEFQIKRGSTGKYCSKSCAAKINNLGRIRTIESKNKIRQCLIQGHKNFLYQRNSIIDSNYPHTLIIFEPCMICNKEFYSRKDKKRRFTCSSLCLSKSKVLAGQKSASIQIKRSKQEIELYDLIKSSILNIQHNQVITEGWDADIILPNQKIAILWNGPWHYREMLGLEHSLKQVHNRDVIKRKVLRNLGWRVLIFEDRYWTPKEASTNVLKLVGNAGFEPKQPIRYELTALPLS